MSSEGAPDWLPHWFADANRAVREWRVEVQDRRQLRPASTSDDSRATNGKNSVLSRLERFEYAYLAYRFVSQLVPIYATYAILITQHGVSPVSLSLLLLSWSISAAVFELPSGVLADQVSRRWLLMSACLVKSGCFVAWIVEPSFWGFMVGFVLWGLASAIRSGAEEALVYDLVGHQGMGRGFERVFGRGAAAGSLGTGIAFLAGGYLVDSVGYTPVLVVSAVSPLLGALFVLSWPATGEARRGVTRLSLWRTLTNGTGSVLRSKSLFAVVAVAVALTPIWSSVDEFLGVFLLEKASVSLGFIGLVYAGATGANVVAVSVAHRFVGGGLKRVLRIYGLAVVALAAAVPLSGVYAGLFLVISLGLNGLASILLDGLLQRAVDDASRATTVSVKGLLQAIAGAGVFVFCGWVAGADGWHMAIAGICIVASVLWVPAMYLFRRDDLG